MRVSGKSEFIPAPEGVHNAVCVDVVDLGLVETAFGEKPKLKLVWEIEAKMENGKRFIVHQRYGASIHPKATLHKHLAAWRGKPFSAADLTGFELESVIGKPCQIVIAHAEKDGAVYANVQAVVKAGAVKLMPNDSPPYERIKDRPGYEAPKQHASGASNGTTRQAEQDRINKEFDAAAESEANDDIPF